MRAWQDRLVEKPRTFTIQNNPDGTITLIPAPGDIIQEGTPVNAAGLNGIEADLLLVNDISGTVQTPTYTGEDITKIEHKLILDDSVVRTDEFNFSVDNQITEIRTLATSESITLTHFFNLDESYNRTEVI